MSLPDCASVARIKRPHGVRGELAVEALTDEPDEGEVFAHELVGMTLIDAESDEVLGEVIEFYDLPQGLLIEFRGPKGVHSLPFVEEFVDEVDRDARRIIVRPPDGLLDG